LLLGEWLKSTTDGDGWVSKPLPEGDSLRYAEVPWKRYIKRHFKHSAGRHVCTARHKESLLLLVFGAIGETPPTEASNHYLLQ
jgi:hypothetical protein